MDASNKLTFVNFNVLVITLAMGLLLFFLPRRYAIVPLIVTACFLTLGQMLVIFGFSFSMMRIILLFGWLRAFFRRELFSFKLINTDKIIILYVLASIIMNTIMRGNFSAFNNRLGFAFDIIGAYFLCRAFVRDNSDIIRICKILAILVIPMAIIILIEKYSGRNMFYVLGGVPEFTEVRDGKLRCQGPFLHPILTGTFGATTIPYFLILYFKKQNRILALFGIISATIITIASSSSGPFIAYMLVIIALIMWPLREHMRKVRWSIFALVILFHLIMKAPVWFLMGKLGHVLGGTGNYRAELIDAAINHIDEWWLYGTHYTAHWMPIHTLPINPDMVDITNQYLREGINGGLLSMFLFIMIIVTCYKNLGRGLHVTKNKMFSSRITFWILGAAMFAHMGSFLSVSYFDQMIIFWYLLIAMISCTAEELKGREITAYKAVS